VPNAVKLKHIKHLKTTWAFRNNYNMNGRHGKIRKELSSSGKTVDSNVKIKTSFFDEINY